MPHYFIESDQIDQGIIRLRSDLEHHLLRVLRIKVGEHLSFVDERPTRYQAKAISIHPGRMAFKIASETLRPTKDFPKIRLCVALIKRDKMDWMVQKATELGVSRISPMLTERTVVRPDLKRRAQQVDRWKKIALEASQQSCRWNVPKLDPPIPLKNLFATPASNGGRYIFSEQAPTSSRKTQITQEISDPFHEETLLIGPEGGWTPTELSEAETAGYLPLSLGEQILRTETAALAALTILQYEIANGNCHIIDH